MITAQDPFRLIPTARRCSNVFALWNNRDSDMIQGLARKCGITAEKLVALFREHCSRIIDSIWIDMTPGSPALFRKNNFQILNIRD